MRPNESLFQLQGHGRQRRQINQDRMFAAHPLPGFAVNAAKISHIAAAVRFTVGVDNLAIETGFRNASPVVIANHRRGIYDKHDNFALLRFSQKRHHAIFGVVKIDPIESIVGVI